MAEERVQRRLAAILAADVVGYSRLMGIDEAETHRRLKGLQHDVIGPRIAQFGGRIFKTTGDGIFVEFASATEAVRCAVELQGALTEAQCQIPEQDRIVLRIGVSLGDVIVDGEDLFGNGVNVASRMEALAEAGGVCISGNVHEHVRSTSDLDFHDLGDKSVKNIDRPIRCYRIGAEGPGRSSATDALVARDERPGIAVLPFDNMSGDPSQEHFSDGITEDLITALSRVREFAVIARNTTFTYKGRAVDIVALARDLGVRYVLEGSVRMAGDRARITAQLIDGRSGNHIWSERYDREIEDIFAVQDEITRTVVGTIGPQLTAAERERALSVPPENLSAWELYHQGLHYIDYNDKMGEPDDLVRAAELFEAASRVAPRFSKAWTGLARCYYIANLFGIAKDRFGDTEAGLAAALRAVELDNDDPNAHTVLGGIHVIRRETEAAIRELRLATEENPSHALAFQVLGIALISTGDPVAAQQATETALRLSPRDEQTFARYLHLALARLHQDDYEGAVDYARRAVRFPRANYPARMALVSALALAGRIAEAADECAVLLRQKPDLTIALAREVRPYTDERSREQFLDGLRKAGLPE